MDLGGAKLFLSPEHAKNYFDRGVFQNYSLVELEVKATRVVAAPKQMSDRLGQIIAEQEAREIEAILEKHGVERMKARIKELEATVAKLSGTEPSDLPSETKKIRSRL